MVDTPDNRAGWQAINRRVIDHQRTILARDELATVHEHDHNVDHDADLSSKGQRSAEQFRGGGSCSGKGALKAKKRASSKKGKQFFPIVL